jgi:predicted RNA-binding Zn ribbon-like protein
VVSATANVNYVASGILLPVPLAGDPALELCNTFAGWGEDAGREYLLSHEHLVVWARERGLVAEGVADELVTEGRVRPQEAGRVLDRTKRLRRAFYAVAAGAPGDEDRLVVAREAERASARARLEWEPRPAWVLPSTPELPLLAVARAIGAFVTDPLRVGRCPGRGCGWLFTDPTGRRRWCSMAVCGNREKARRHALRAARTKGNPRRTGGGGGGSSR